MGEVKERPPWHVVVPGGGPQGLPAQQEVNWSGALAFYPVLKGEKTALEAYQPSAKLKLGSKEDLREAGLGSPQAIPTQMTGGGKPPTLSKYRP